MPKRKSSTNINKSAKKISLETITSIDGGLGNVETNQKVSQTDNYFADEMPEYFFY